MDLEYLTFSEFQFLNFPLSLLHYHLHEYNLRDEESRELLDEKYVVQKFF